MSNRSANITLAFSAAGHAYTHLFEPIFYIVALILPQKMGLPYGEVLALILVGKILYGLVAPAAGWLGDRWSMTGMMSVYFLGLGMSAIGVGLSQTPLQMAIALSFVGLFGSIYHPVGMTLLTRNAVNKGCAIGINGIFGGFGPAFAGLIAGGLIAVADWRAAFIAPGLVVILTGFAFWFCLKKGWMIEATSDRKVEMPPTKNDAWKVGIILAITMMSGGLVYQATQIALPKFFEDRLGDITLFGIDRVAAISGAVMIVYAIAGLFQAVAGYLADKYPAERVYLLAFLCQGPLLWLAADLSGLPLIVIALMMVSFNMAAIPAENLLLARYAPSKWRGTAFGLKFVFSFGVSALAIPLVGFIHDRQGDFFWLFVLLAAFSVIAAFTVLFFPSKKAKKPDFAEPSRAVL